MSAIVRTLGGRGPKCPCRWTRASGWWELPVVSSCRMHGRGVPSRGERLAAEWSAGYAFGHVAAPGRFAIDPR